ncbi:hypothetical protein ANTQUA_LOCUS5902 [Anthophora quadrimaculata]
MRFLRGTWWDCGLQTLLTIFKSLIRSKIEYGIWWLYPTHNKGFAPKLERLQAQTAKLALRLRSSTPNKVALVEARLPPIEVRARFLGSNEDKGGPAAVNSPSGSSISLLWVPAHRNINGNKLADEATKEASLNPPDFHQVAYTDYYHSLKQEMSDQAEEARTIEASHKGVHYFRNFHSTVKNPWFHNLSIPRFTSSWVSRYRAGHYGLGVSLSKIGAGSASCPCGHSAQDINHILWDYSNPALSQNREPMPSKLKQYGWTPPLRVDPFLQRTNLCTIRTISDFLKSSNLKI